MENSTVYDRKLNLPHGIIDIDKNINNNDFVYIDDRSLKLIPIDRKDLSLIQKSLREELHEGLKSAGRTNLAKRSIEGKLITYTMLEFLEAQINKPRTKQTLLNNIPQQLFTSIQVLPDLVRNDMEDKGMTGIPNNITYLHCIETGQATGTHSLPLIKYLTTQCMEIDFNSSFETLEEEHKECLEILFSEHNPELLQNTGNCVTTLNILRDIWNLQDSLNWNTITIQPAAQYCLDTPSENLLLDQPLPIDTEHEANTKVDPNTTEPTKSAKRKTKKKAKAEADQSESTQTISPKQPALASPVTPSSEPLNSDSDNKTTEPLPSQLDKTPEKVKQIPESKPKAACLLPETTLNKQTYSISSQGARPKEATYSVSSQGARPKKKITSSPESITNVQNGMHIKNPEAFNTLVIETCMEMRKDLAKREATVEKFIANPENEELFEKARKALNRRAWPAGRLHDLLVAAHSSSDNTYFITRKDFLIKNGSFVSGHPPMDVKNKKHYMFSRPRNLEDMRSGAIHYVTISGVTPTEALDSCFRDFFIADSGVIVELILLKTLRRFWGDRVFNKFFNAEEPLQLTSFGSIYRNPRIRHFLKPINLTCFKDTQYVKGYLYSFLNYPDYIKKDFNGEYNVLFAFCTDAATLRFCNPALFENASLPTVNEKLVELYNKEPYNGKIMDEDSWITLRKTFNNDPNIRSITNAIEYISVQHILLVQSNPQKTYAHKINFKMACRRKVEYINIIKKEEVQKERSAKHTKNYMKINKEKVTPIPDSPSLLPETSKPENPSEANKANIVSTRKSNAIRAIRNYGKCKATPEEVHEAFLAFESFLLPLKDDEPQLFTEHQNSYKKIREQANKIRGTDTH